LLKTNIDVFIIFRNFTTKTRDDGMHPSLMVAHSYAVGSTWWIWLNMLSLTLPASTCQGKTVIFRLHEKIGVGPQNRDRRYKVALM